MAKSNKSLVTGKSVKDLTSLNIDTFNKLSTSDLRKVVSRLASAGNKRLKSFEQSGDISPAARYVQQSGGKFSTKGKNLNQLRAEYLRAKNFLQSKTGTRAGWRNTKKKTISALKESGVSVTEEQFNTLWRSYEDLKEINPEISSKRMKYTMLREISDNIVDDSTSPEDIAAKLRSEINRIYEERAAQDNEIGGVSEFFEL